MSKLSTETVCLLDKVYNLRGSESTILVEMEKEMNSAVESYEEANTIRKELEENINKLNNDVEVLSSEGEKLKNVLNDIDEREYAQVLDTLKIDFHPEEIKEKLASLLPITINSLSSDIKMSSNELSRVEEKLEETKTKIEELNIQKEEALVNQDRLNRYFELSLNSNMNATRDELTHLFSEFDFSDEESRECAKLLMFPEDGIFEYEKDYKDAPRVRHYEPEQEEIEIAENHDFEEEPAISFIDEEEPKVQIEEIPSEEYSEIEPMGIEEIHEEEFAPAEEIITPIEKVAQTEETIAPVEETIQVEDVSEPVITVSRDEVVSFLTDLGFDTLDFTTNDIDKITDNFDRELITNNVNTIKDMGINMDVFADNIELLYDTEMKSKIEKLTSVGKLPQDIYLNPSVLTKYNLTELDSAIKLLEDSGLEPKNVPLMAY